MVFLLKWWILLSDKILIQNCLVFWKGKEGLYSISEGLRRMKKQEEKLEFTYDFLSFKVVAKIHL